MAWGTPRVTVNTAGVEAGNAALQYQGQADDAIAQSIKAAQDAANKKNQYQLDYGKLSSGISALGQYPDQMLGLANQLAPYADTFNQYGRDLWQQGLGVFGQGTSLMNTG